MTTTDVQMLESLDEFTFGEIVYLHLVENGTITKIRENCKKNWDLFTKDVEDPNKPESSIVNLVDEISRAVVDHLNTCEIDAIDEIYTQCIAVALYEEGLTSFPQWLHDAVANNTTN